MIINRAYVIFLLHGSDVRFIGYWIYLNGQWTSYLREYPRVLGNFLALRNWNFGTPRKKTHLFCLKLNSKFWQVVERIKLLPGSKVLSGIIMFLQRTVQTRSTSNKQPFSVVFCPKNKKSEKIGDCGNDHASQ